MRFTQQYLIQSIVPQPVSYFESNFGPLSRKICLSGYSHSALKDLAAKVCGRIPQAEGKEGIVETIHSCVDNSLQGVIFPEFSAGLIGFDAFDPFVYSRLRDFDEKKAAEYGEQLEAARFALKKARDLHNKQEDIYIRHMHFDVMDRLTEETINKVLGGKGQKTAGRSVHRFFGAASVNGTVCYIPQLTEELSKRYFIKGRPGTGKSTFLKKIAAAAVERGFFAEIYHCSLDPNSLDMLILRQLGICLFDSTAPHEFFPSRPEDEIIDMYEKCVTPGVDETYGEELARLEAGYKELTAEAVSRLKKAKEIDDGLQALLPPLSDDALEKTAEAISRTLFG